MEVIDGLVLNDGFIIPSHYPIGHICTYPGCKNVLVLDGNMKNRRDICGAKDAGWIQYPGLPGCIKTGCMASPAFKSPFCAEHKVRGVEGECTPDELVVEMLLGKKETRNGKYYEVCSQKMVI